MEVSMISAVVDANNSILKAIGQHRGRVVSAGHINLVITQRHIKIGAQRFLQKIIILVRFATK